MTNRSTFDDVMVPNYSPLPIIPVRGKGSRIWDENNNEYIDLAGGIAVSCLGHCHPKLVQRLQQQAENLWHVSNVLTNQPALRLAQKLTELTFAEKVFFANSGAEANEAALKLARKYAYDHFGPEKTQIISFENSFHGRTLFTVSAGGQAKYSDGFGPLPGDIDHAVYNDLASVEALISEKTCAVIIEPIQGEGGVKSASKDFLKGLRELCDKHNALLIFDEIQTGAGRTGELYAYQNVDVIPDILTTAKGIGGGFPIGAMLTTTEIAKSLVVGTHGSTYGGNPLGCAVAEVVVDIISDRQLLDNVKTKHRKFMDGLDRINERHKIFSDIRGSGLLIGCELKEAYHGKAKDLLTEALSQNLMVLVAGPNVMRLAPSLIIPDEDIEQGLMSLDKAIASFLSKQD
ncbi:aspartate aminotransferase family protein [Litoribrevibacter albus]|uniref:Acetylornithine aminotransferase n=1 Tax=Litoribrevibacter albus TaxID=1473156 RepID=A0AA37SE96_9GAMM|nr:aspartate aminotransferase family protein [Litoribrevibacter albus]GLQ32916.1 acetylornithine aminotransferase [Litoribrevibacter albus]